MVLREKQSKSYNYSEILVKRIARIYIAIILHVLWASRCPFPEYKCNFSRYDILEVMRAYDVGRIVRYPEISYLIQIIDEKLGLTPQNSGTEQFEELRFYDSAFKIIYTNKDRILPDVMVQTSIKHSKRLLSRKFIK